MAKTKGFLNKAVHEPIFNKTSIGSKPSLQKMNKSKRRNFKPYKGQGKQFRIILKYQYEVYVDYNNLLTNLWELYASHE